MSDKSAGAPYCLPTSPEKRRQALQFPDSHQAAGRSQNLTVGGRVTGFPREQEKGIWGACDQDACYMYGTVQIDKG